jgi:hypothetical protein
VPFLEKERASLEGSIGWSSCNARSERQAAHSGYSLLAVREDRFDRRPPAEEELRSITLRIDKGPALKMRLITLAALQQAIKSEAQDQNYQPTEIIRGVIHGR